MTVAAANATTDETIQHDEPSALRQAADLATTQPASEAPAIPEKFQVKKEDGSLDYEASSIKMAQSYSYLEKKLGTGEAPPKSHEEYQVQFSEEVPISFDEIKADPVVGQFMEGAHKLGMTNAQVSYVLDTYMKVLPQDLEAASQLSANETIETLTTELGETRAKEVLADAYRAVTMVAGDDADYIMDNYGNDPVVLKYLAKFGEGLREDSPPLAMQTIDPAEFGSVVHDLREQLAQMPVTDPRRPAMLQKLDDLYNRQYGKAPAHGMG
jgi:hypothetical protein